MGALLLKVFERVRATRSGHDRSAQCPRAPSGTCAAARRAWACGRRLSAAGDLCDLCVWDKASLPSFRSACGKTPSAYTHAEFACASRGTPPALTWRPVCFVRTAWSSRQACGDREIVGLQFVEPAPYSHVPWHPANGCLTVVRVCTDASRMPACERSRTHTLRPLNTRVPICVPHRTTVPYMRRACLHASEHLRAHEFMLAHAFMHANAVGAPMQAYATTYLPAPARHVIARAAPVTENTFYL
jgi:hypothetical protein